MKTNLARLAATLGLLIGTVLTASAEIDTTKLGRIELASVQRPEVVTAGGKYLLRIDVTFRNRNVESLKLRNATFRLAACPGQSEAAARLDVGKGWVSELILPGTGAKPGASGVAAVQLTIEVGPKTEETSDRLFELLNLLAKPDAAALVNLRCTSEVGLELPRGWAYEVGKIYEVEMGLEPQVGHVVPLK